MRKNGLLLGAAGTLAAALMLSSAVTSPIATYAQDATPVPPTATPNVAEAGSGENQIIFWNGLSGSDGVTLNAMTAKFAEANPGYAVRTEILLWDTLYQKFQAAVVAGDAPDLVLMHTSELPQFVQFGALQPIDDLYGTGEGQIDPADYSPAALEAVTIDGQRYGLPLDNHGWGMWANNELFEKAGLDASTPPANLQEFVDLATKLTLDVNGKNPGQDGFDATNIAQYGTTVSWMRVTFLTLLYQNGGNLISEDGETIGINSDAGKAALQTMYDLIYKYNVAPKPAGFDNWQSFAAGKIAMIPEGSWFRNFLVLDNPNIKFTTWKMPQFGTQPATWMSAHVFYIPSTTEGAKLESVKTYLRWMAANNGLWAESGQIPASIASQGLLNPDTYPSNITYANAFNEYGRFDPSTDKITELMSTLDPELEAVLNGQKSLEEGLAAAAERMQAILDR